MLNLIQLFTTFDLLSSIKFIFAVFVLLKCLEVLVTIIRKKANSNQQDHQETMPLVLSEHVSVKEIQSETKNAGEDEDEVAKDGKIEINNIKNKTFYKFVNKENEHRPIQP